MPMNVKEGDEVEWDWDHGTAMGVVQSVYARKTTCILKGAEISRKGSNDNPALYIKQKDGSAILRLASEVRGA